MKPSATPDTVPGHIAIIMDGNRRWAREHRLPVLEGHRRVVSDVLFPLISHASDCGIRYLTFWAWSTENWKRTKPEVEGILKLFGAAIRQWSDRLYRDGVRVRIIGDTTRFPDQLQNDLSALVMRTKENNTITVVFALNYGGRDEIVRAMNTWHKISNIKYQISKMSIDDFSEFLDTAGIPDPDMIVRTGGEQRLSGFLPWQSVYSELYFPSWYMPEFTPKHLDDVVREFMNRKRRFGR